MNKFKKALPWIFAGTSIATIIGSNIATAKSTIKAYKAIKEKEKELGRELTSKEKIKLCTPIYIPSYLATAAGAATVISSTVLSEKDKTKLSAAVSTTKELYSKYKKAVDKVVDGHTLQEINKEYNDISFLSRRPNVKAISMDDNSEDETVLFYFEPFDTWGNEKIHTGYFESKLSTVKNAFTMLNQAIEHNGECTLNYLLGWLHLPRMKDGDSIVWSSAYGYSEVTFDYQKFQYDDGLECIVIYPEYEPEWDY